MRIPKHDTKQVKHPFYQNQNHTYQNQKDTYQTTKQVHPKPTCPLYLYHQTQTNEQITKGVGKK